LIYNTYNNLKREKTILEIRINDYEEEKKKLRKLAKIDGPTSMKAIDYSSTPVQSTSQIGFKYYLDRVRKIDNHLLLHQERLDKVNKLMKQIETELKELKGNHYDIAYKRFVEGKKQELIAEEMNLSTRHVRRIMSDLTKNMVCPSNVL